MTPPTTGYTHAEAYCLMTYRSEDGTEDEVIWNSRDGVTPFVISLRSGKVARHVDWDRDRPAPDYRPPPGTRMFVDITEDRAREAARVNAERWWADNVADARSRFASVEEMVVNLALIYFTPGAPDLVEVP